MFFVRRFLFFCLSALACFNIATAAQINVSNVTASSTWYTYDVNSLVNGTGLSGNLHSGDFQGKWMTNTTSTGWLVFGFDSIFSLSSTTIWNYGTGCCGEDRSTKDLTVSTSLDGVNFSPVSDLVLSIPITDPFAGESIALSDVDAKFVRFDLRSNYGADYIGLSEVAFFGDTDDDNQIPEPASLALLGLGLAGLGFSRRRKV